MADETILVGSFSHETNTYSSEPTTREHFQERREAFGDEVPDQLAGTNSSVGGAIDVAEDEGVTLVHTGSASATPGGYVSEDAYKFYTETIVEGTKECNDLDGVFLALHGAMVPEGMDDGEGPLIAAVRDVVGPETPIVVTLDLHGNVTDEMVDEADALVAYETYPHVDSGETGRTGMTLLLEAIRGEIDPTMAIERPPVLAFGPKQNTREGPMADMMALAREQEQREGVRKVNVMPGFSAADIPSMGASITAVTDGDEELAEEVAREVGTRMWERREEFVGEYPDVEDAVARAIDLAADGTTADGPVVLADVGDNPGGGGPADSTFVLRELLDQGATNAGLAIMRDPEVVDACVEAGVGETVTVTIGGKTDDLHGEPIEDVEGYVKAITDGEFVNTGPMGTGTDNDLGRAVRLECGSERTGTAQEGSDGVTVIVTDYRLQPLDAEIWRHVGIQPERLDILAVKSMNHFRADYEPMASEVIPINTPGLSTMDARNYDYSTIRRPQFPIDEMDDDAYPA